MKHCSTSLRRENRERSKIKNSVRWRPKHLSISSWRFCTKLLAHATAARLSPLNLHHHRHCLRPRHTAVCWRDPRPLPLTGQRTDRWSSRTPTPIQWVVREGRVLSTVGIAPIRLHLSMTLHHRAVKGRRREEEEKAMSDASWWSPAPLGRRRSAGRRASPSVHGADPKDRRHHRPAPRCQPRRPIPSPRWVRC
jgi:hypothetical protein